MVIFLGYDPGGNNAHGVATLVVSPTGVVTSAGTHLFATAANAAAYFANALAQGDVGGIGVDTLTEWCLGRSGWRPADQWLRSTYPRVAGSVASPNGLRGSMCLNGLGVVNDLRVHSPGLVVSETHPKALYFAISGNKYYWPSSAHAMRTWLCRQLAGVQCVLNTEHEFDALLSAWACMQGVLGRWTQDLHTLPATTTIVRPVGSTHYYWP